MTAEYQILRGLFIRVIHLAFDDARKEVLDARRKLRNEVSRAKPQSRQKVEAFYQARVDQAIAAHRRYFESKDYRIVCSWADLFIRPDDMMRAIEAPEVET
ncbi:hypothetical protein [Paracoccus hibiscisoli]|uniref:Uncharacterized protein n=1 Tax=Paracoccus hibiscisoli TaxID=2023261 RepID=A0A4U0QUN9_9RHOB|nr:hypothetical protein [Paracoccus hibiscisoli]TJZ85817.1 hypothetical protein FA740_05300 [Paracoccus hibiscisoli]